MVTKFEKHIVITNENGDKIIHANDNSYHFKFRKKDGLTMKWGATVKDDPTHSPFGPEIADIELTKVCAGVRNPEGVYTICRFCYKSCTSCSKGYMPFDTFAKLLEVLTQNQTLTQIAFGTDASLSSESNPDYWKIFEYCSIRGITPNVTVADITEETAKKLCSVMGAVAVSYYPLTDKNRCYDSVKLLTDNAYLSKYDFKVNIHCLLAEETKKGVYELLKDVKNDPRLQNLNAIVFLSLKQKGRGEFFNKLNMEDYSKIINFCRDNNISYGMDSCSCNKFFEVIKDWKEASVIKQFCEPCEATLFSSYFDYEGTYYPCSFMEHTGEWEEGIKLADVNKLEDIWNNEKVEAWRKQAIENINKMGCNKCPFFEI